MNEDPDLAKFLEQTVQLRTGLEWLEIFLQDVAGDNDRSAAITLATLVDDGLGLSIKARLIPMSNTFLDRLYSEEGPLGSFNKKIHMGFALGLYGQQTCSDLHITRRIRNRFAHTFDASTFDDEKIALLCKRLRTPDILDQDIKTITPRFSEEKTRYFVTMVLIWTNLNATHDSLQRISPAQDILP